MKRLAVKQYALDSALPVLLRPDGRVQIGWGPRRAVLVRPLPGLTAADMAALLRSLQTESDLTDLLDAAARHGFSDTEMMVELLEQLVRAGVVRANTASRRAARSASIRIHGRGPLSDLLTSSLRCSGARIRHSTTGNAAVTADDDADLVVLSDYLVADPRMLRGLHSAGVAHLPVRVRDGAGLIGPLVIPGVTSCLRCADLHRGDRDEAWPAVAAQLRDTVGVADRATVLATAALALSQVDRVIDAVRGTGDDDTRPPTMDATLEFDVKANTILSRRWTRHPRCGCWR